jgi:cobalt-zinc-cadmium efflux system outer membrane protein
MRTALVLPALLLALANSAAAQQTPPQPSAPAPTSAAQSAQASSPSARITLLALRSTILQSQANEITAKLRPDPVLSWDAQFLPIFQPSQFSADYIDNNAQFDAGIGYRFERGKKRQHCLRFALDTTNVVRSRVSDYERQFSFNVAQQFINVLLAESTLDFAQQDLDSFRHIQGGGLKLSGHSCKGEDL